ncbi:MAG: glycerol-3-phosphate acyltransferase [Candidatus Eisenbacteria bacterium]
MVGAFFGHMFTPFAGFRGGKGVATAAGAWAALVPYGLLAALLTWIVLFATTRLVSLASVLAAIVLPIAVWVFGHRSVTDPFLWLSLLTAVFIVVRHRSNLGRLRRGQESRLAVRRQAGAGHQRNTAAGSTTGDAAGK